MAAQQKLVKMELEEQTDVLILSEGHVKLC